jgi:hypothetical protein
LPWVVCPPTVAVAKVADATAHAISQETTTAENHRHVMAAILLPDTLRAGVERRSR